jgi:hypothetical protein
VNELVSGGGGGLCTFCRRKVCYEGNDLGVDGWMILKWILKKLSLSVWTRLICLTRGACDEPVSAGLLVSH